MGVPNLEAFLCSIYLTATSFHPSSLSVVEVEECSFSSHPNHQRGTFHFLFLLHPYLMQLLDVERNSVCEGFAPGIKPSTWLVWNFFQFDSYLYSYAASSFEIKYHRWSFFLWPVLQTSFGTQHLLIQPIHQSVSVAVSSVACPLLPDCQLIFYDLHYYASIHLKGQWSNHQEWCSFEQLAELVRVAF